MNLSGHARLRKFLFDKGFFGRSTLWWLDQQGIHFVVPSKTPMAVVADARAQTAAGEDLAVGRRVHTVRHGQGRTAWAERLETRVVGVTSLTTDDHYGSQEHGRQQHRRDFQPNLINAVVVRKWLGKDDGPGGKTVFLSNASVAAGLARRGRMVPLLAAGPRGPPEVAIHVARLACERPDLLASSISPVGLRRTGAPAHRRGDRGGYFHCYRPMHSDSASSQTLAASCVASPQAAGGAVFSATIAALIDLYTCPLQEDEMVLSVDEKTSLQPRPRPSPTLPAQPHHLPSTAPWF
jgi:hypothetical protein